LPDSDDAEKGNLMRREVKPKVFNGDGIISYDLTRNEYAIELAERLIDGEGGCVGGGKYDIDGCIGVECHLGGCELEGEVDL
jgi:hypothetical protein